MLRLTIFLIWTIPFGMFGQSEKLECLKALSSFEWHAKGMWGDGSPFVQTIRLGYGLDSQMVHVRSLGFVDKEQTVLGHRNQGVRTYDASTGTVRFWEFDIFGGITEGTMSCQERDIIYTYQYGDSEVTDMWSYINDSTYSFTVGSYLGGLWQQKYLETHFKRIPMSKAMQSLQLLRQNIVGSWSSLAWDGILTENWGIDEQGDIIQEARYTEEGVVLYESTNKIQVVDNDLILTTIIKDNNPKIFKATTFSKDSIVFENTDYKNPSRIVYQFIDDTQFARTISGVENDQPTSYTFKFAKKQTGLKKKHTK